MRITLTMLLAIAAQAEPSAAKLTSSECRVLDQFTRAASSLAGAKTQEPWSREHSSRLMSPSAAEHVAATDAVRLRDALVHQDFATVAQYVDDRICLMAAKGAACRWMSKQELVGCSQSRRREVWDVDTGADTGPRLNCREAFGRIFLGHPGLAKAAPAFNCFPERGDNNAASLINPAVVGDIYVEFFAPESEHPAWHGWRSLWLTLVQRNGQARLVPITSHYWGI